MLGVPLPEPNEKTTILLTGATGYVGGQLLPLLEKEPVQLRCMARKPSQLQEKVCNTTQLIAGDVLDEKSLHSALAGVDIAYYLIHLMSASGDFEADDRRAAQNFARAAKQAGVKRIVYLGGLGDDDDPQLSPHLRSRHEVGDIFRDSGIETIEFRAGMVLGSGSLSFQLMKSLTDRLPVMLCPRWLKTPTQPIAIDDILAYLLAAWKLPNAGSRVYEVGSQDVVTYGEIIQEYARQMGQRRWLIYVPVLTPYLSGLWLALVTPSTYTVGRYLIEGLKNPTVVRNRQAEIDFSITPLGVRESIIRAIENQQNLPQ